jgi:hypothetical protein
MLDDAFKEIIMYKAENMKTGLNQDSGYNGHIKRVLGQPITTVSDEQVQNFVIGAVDAMIYDVASLVGFDSDTRDYSNWASRSKRQEILREIFPPNDRQKKAFLKTSPTTP